jgi:pimeloyl-ACP methyl ester carboxylesterase
VNVSTTKRHLGAVGLAVALLGTTACSTEASNQPAATAEAPETTPDTTTATTATTPRPSSTTALRPTETVDDLVRVSDGRLHVRCVGAGEATIVLIAGFNDGGENWGRITPALSGQARVCSYARFGTGASDPPTTPQTFATSARDLHALLNELGEPGPYIVVGHSYGGAQAVTFAERYPTEVEALLLLDATPPTWTAAGCAVPDDGSDAAAGFVARCPDPAHPTDNPEHLDEVTGFAQVAAIDTVGSMPMTVVTAAEHPFPGLDPIEAARLEDVWNHGQEHWTSLSSAPKLVTVEDTGHYIQLDRPAVVIAEIEKLLPAPPSAPAPAPLRWEPCGGRLQCGSLDVPVDPDDATGAMISLSLARLPATDSDARIGTLITNPGGPGGSGVEFLGNDGPFDDEVNRRFDIVSWDPRGVGGSAPLQCGSGFTDTLLSADLAPRDAAGRATLERSLAANVQTCQADDASLLAHIGADAAVSDLEAIRLALGGDQITYVGFSYGTLIGLRYAEHFPDGLRAMVLDGIVEPEANLGERLIATAASLDRALAEILDACGPDCPITGDPLEAYRVLAETARSEPLRSGDSTDVGFNAVAMAGIAVTYDDELRGPFYEAIAQGQRDDGTLFKVFADGFVEDFELGPNFAVDCLDMPHPTTSAEVEALASQAADAATVLPELSGAYVRVFALPCLYWPVPAPTVLDPVIAAGAPPILVVGNTGDPVTPSESAERVAASLRSGHLLTYVGDGHTTYRKNHCADAHIDSYLLDLRLPPPAASCP